MNPQSEPLRPLLDALPSGTLLLLDRLDCGGAFLLPLLARAAVQGGHKVLFIAAAHSPARHAAALRKLGLVQQQGAVAFVEGSSSSRQEAAQAAAADHQQCGAPLQDLTLHIVAAARQLLQASPEAQAVSGSPAGLTLVLDSLDALNALCPSQMHINAFLHSCRALGASLPAPHFRFVVAAAADVPDAGGTVCAQLHACDAVLDLTPVEGRTAELDGRLDVTLRRLPWAALKGGGGGSGVEGQAPLPAASCGRLPGMEAWHFRAGDVAVRWLQGQLDGRELMA